MTTPYILKALHPVIDAFEKSSVSYYIGGSVASSMYGIARATLDVDIVADVKQYHITTLKKHLQDKYYIDETMIQDAIKDSSSFNLIHLETAIKIDVFIFKDEPYQRNAMERRIKDTFDDDQELTYYFSSPEDIIIAKLQWYEKGERVSERQWLDIIGVIKVQGGSLDSQYLEMWTQKLGVVDLLRKAFQEAGITL